MYLYIYEVWYIYIFPNTSYLILIYIGYTMSLDFRIKFGAPAKILYEIMTTQAYKLTKFKIF